jgi:starch synthase (maltosyl-transferring)
LPFGFFGEIIVPVTAPRICHAGNAADRGRVAKAIAQSGLLGFSHVAVTCDPGDGVDGEIRLLGEACTAANLDLVLDVNLTDLPIEHPLVRMHPECFWLTADSTASFVDPRLPNLIEGRAIARPHQNPEPYLGWWAEWFNKIAQAGACSFLIAQPDALGARLWQELTRRTHDSRAEPLFFIADTSQVPQDAISKLAGAGFGYCLSALPWWNGRDAWFADQHAIMSAVAPVLALVESPRCEPPASCALRRARLAIAAVSGAGVLMPFGFDAGECDGDGLELSSAVRAMNVILASESVRGALRSLTGPGDAVTILLRTDSAAESEAQSGLLVVVNPHHVINASFDDGFSPALGEWSVLESVEAFAGEGEKLGPGEARLFRAARQKPIVVESRTPASSARIAAQDGRVWIGNISPAVDAGAFPAKATAGEIVQVEADLVSEGHGVLSAELLFRADDERNWHRVSMKPAGNDRWWASMPVRRVGRHRFSIESWPDVYATFAQDLAKKRTAKLDISLDLEEGRKLIEAWRDRETKSARQTLSALLTSYARASIEQRAALLLAPETTEAMARADPRDRKTSSPVYCIDADRRVAQFGSWYELFPRSQSPVAGRHGTFRDVSSRIPAIAAMGFDVLYLTPIHPIGTTNRKGRNNDLIATEVDPGSTYAIGSSAGGHTATHPELGTLAEFHELVRAALDSGMEIALDFAIQCSLDHPWLKEHPGWFDWRPDGTIKYAENPPKRYEDIVNVDFFANDAIPDLWMALRSVVLFWIKRGVRIFRVDNPHTKPFAFWQWLLSDIRKLHPDVVFLSEAFTRPKLMHHLAKLGFSQSYTYFTWRNGKQELMEYINELNSIPVAWFFRPNFFVNTPDINPPFLHSSGRAGFVIRAALAALLSGSWGMYSGFELCESEPLPGREEYKDSEKYEIKFRDWDATRNIVPEITTLNRLRRSEPALQSHLGTTFYNVFNNNIICFGRSNGRGTDRILVAISLNPHGPEEADFEIPLWEWGLPDSGALLAQDLLRGGSFVWHGKMQHLWLSPNAPFSVWRVRPAEAS